MAERAGRDLTLELGCGEGGPDHTLSCLQQTELSTLLAASRDLFNYTAMMAVPDARYTRLAQSIF